MNPQAQELNEVISAKNSVVFDLLSEKGRNIFFPKKGILGQTAEAKGTKINATIGAAIEDDGTPMRLESIASKINMDPSLSFPYAPSFGRPDLRSKWKEMIYEKNPSLQNTPISLPIVTSALTHGISMAGYLWMNEDEEVIVPDLFWGNYNLALIHAYGVKFSKFKLFKNNRFNTEALKESLMSEGEKKVVILNFPNNPTGYTPTVEEMQTIVATIKEAAEAGKKIVAITDDAYFGLVFEEGIEQQSIFSYLANLHQNVLAVKVDGATKEDYVWGFRVGFITYGIKGGDEDLYHALEMKTAGAVRGNISNSSNLSQSLLLHAFESPDYTAQKHSKFVIMKTRYEAIKEVLADTKFEEYFTTLPYNSGYFMCIQLKEGLDGEAIREILINKYSIGIINLNNILRVAFSAMSASDAKPLFEGIYKACKDYENQ
ncbi:aminotransferase class I/II-fold pyridoxal phosphate-dependent enzyme [Plebeiibacterium marinum]|uniref:Aminotransferase class I/II-fold pyridoxal phosphate-dependent enzyme n=1 Tax=Plebeiibacterium marinum TaxID=2992111 RepID=A0AAE3SLC3_9BACT|nr:aminotransferase class I/II-fold pyridoxal phosphate-dependent enzyme [Plebeiobacterium marinum]MCW3807547.1 aminotransferase class I/II-fold pyridoxal phosphate-dependent enzyme [Plebeiobacterium marinum]